MMIIISCLYIYIYSNQHIRKAILVHTKKTYLMTCAVIEDSDQPIFFFAQWLGASCIHPYIPQYPMVSQAVTKALIKLCESTGWSIYAFVACICSKDHFFYVAAHAWKYPMGTQRKMTSYQRRHRRIDVDTTSFWCYVPVGYLHTMKRSKI